MGYEIDILLNIQRSANNYLGINKSFSLSENNINISIQRNSDKYLKINRNDDSFLNFIQQATQQATQQYPSVQNLSVNSIGDGFVVLQWDSAANAIGYNVYVNSVKYNGTTLSSSQSSSYTIQNLVNGTQYSIYVTALYTGNNESSPSNTILATPNKVQAWYDATHPGPFGSISDLGLPLRHSGPVYYNGKIYIFGPFTGSSWLNKVFYYDPSTGVFTDPSISMEKGPWNSAYKGFYNNKAVLANGYSNIPIGLFDFSTMTFAALVSNLNSFDSGSMAYDYDNDVAILFGGQYSNHVGIYDMKTNNLTYNSPVSWSSQYVAGAPVYDSDTGLIYLSSKGNFYSYNYKTDIWTPLTNIPSANNIGYAWTDFGYIYAADRSSIIYRYTKISDSWELVLDNPYTAKWDCFYTVIDTNLWELGGNNGYTIANVQVAKFT